MTHRTEQCCKECSGWEPALHECSCQCHYSPTDESVVSPTIPERVEEFSKGFDATWNSAVRILLRFIKGEISEEERNAQLKVLDDAEKLRLTTALTETDQQARASELELLAVHLDRQLAGYTNVSVDSVYRYIEQRKETLSNPPSQV